MFFSSALEFETPSRDPLWTPRQCHERPESSSGDDSSGEKAEHDVIKEYNEAMTKIASLTGGKVKPLTFRLTSEWDKATSNEKASCLDQVDEGCRTLCKVIAPKGSEKLLQAYQESKTNVCSNINESTALIAAYKQAPTRSLKTQILSIYGLRYSARFLEKMHEPFAKLSDRQIKKARAHANNVGVGFNVDKVPQHRVRMDLVKLDHFLSFVDQPYFHQDVAYGTRTFQLEEELCEKVVQV